MQLTLLDWLIVIAYAVFAIGVGIRYSRKAGSDVEQFFLSGRSLPWWIAGTSMVATTFAADTPLVITGWVRDHGIWKNWLWWCYAGGGLMTVFLFARYWRRGEIMTKAELSELRYGGSGASVLRGFLGVFHAGITNTIVLCWVLLAAAKIMDVLFGVDKVFALVLASALALSYSLMAGFWGVVLTDMVQFAMAMVGAICLAVISWNAIDGGPGLIAAAQAQGSQFTMDTLAFLPAGGEGGLFSASFWTINLATVAVYMGVAWWAVESVDGGTLVVQRISATRHERDGVLAALWYNIAHFALRPWPWILVALASIIIFPSAEVLAPVDGTVTAITSETITIKPSSGDGVPIELSLLAPVFKDGVEERDNAWRSLPLIKEGASVSSGMQLAKTDSERAYVAMMTRFLPIGLLGIVVASLLAAFMSTIDTHVNLASSFFVNDVYRRFLKRDADAKHYVRVARITSACVLAMAGVMAWQASSISDLFQFFLAFLGGVGPVYVLRWMWWRVRASTEITAMIASSVSTIVLTKWLDTGWPMSPLSPDGLLSAEGRLFLVAMISLVCALISMALTKTPDPAGLVEFFRRVKPMGAWGPVQELCPDVRVRREGKPAILGILGALAATYGVMLGTGFAFLQRGTDATICFVIAAVGTIVVVWSL
ncbi:MAG: SSS family solute:Na+ symporter, partial [Planctomycetota bacterium]